MHINTIIFTVYKLIRPWLVNPGQFNEIRDILVSPKPFVGTRNISLKSGTSDHPMQINKSIIFFGGLGAEPPEEEEIYIFFYFLLHFLGFRVCLERFKWGAIDPSRAGKNGLAGRS